MPKYTVTAPDGATYEVNAPAGATEQDAIAYVQKNLVKSESLTQRVGRELNDIPRQIGLTARHGLEGLGSAAEIVSEPIRYFTDKLIPDQANGGLNDLVAGKQLQPRAKSMPASQLASKLADTLGLPKPRNAEERVIGDATKMGFSAATMGGAASKGANLTSGIASDSLKFLAANPVQQLSSAAGAGLAGGASRESGGGPIEQGVASLVGGLSGAGAASLAQGGANLAKQLFNKGLTQQQLDVKISNALRQTGVDYNQFPEKVKQSLRAELVGALNADKDLDPTALARLAAFKEAGITPTRGMLTQNPVQITREMNLAKMGANTGDETLQGLALLQNQNNQKLIGNLNTLGADRGDTLRAGERVTSSILGNRDSLRSAETAAWDLAKNSPGYRQPVNAGVLSDINAALDAEGMMPFMNPTISKYIEAFQSGRPFTPQDYRNLQSMLAREAAKGGNEAYAAGVARRILEKSDLKPAGFANTNNALVTQGMAAGMRAADDAADESISAINQARNATRSAYAYEDSSPLVRSVLSDGASADPQRIAQRFVIGGTAQEAEDLLNNLGPENIGPIKDAILTHLKSKALGGAADETGKFSQATFNNALKAIGDRKLSILFTPEEIRALKVNGRVASLMLSQPVGSAVNNSNSGALMLGRGYDLLRGIAGKLPVGQQFILDPLRNIEVSLGSRQAQNVLPVLLKEQKKLPAYQPLLLPAAVAGGGLLAP